MFNVDPDVPAKIAFINVIPKDMLKQIDGKTWAAPVGVVLNGKGGGKPESFQGIGSEVTKVEEGKKAAEEQFRKTFPQA